jgi:hypothetical protein
MPDKVWAGKASQGEIKDAEEEGTFQTHLNDLPSSANS